MHHIPDYLMWTVPHSGTRYTKTAFERAGLSAQHGYRWGAIDRDKPDLLWGHVDSHHMHHELGEIASHVEKQFLVTRNPIDVWTTWMYEPAAHDDADDKVGHAMFSLEDHWRAQNELAERGLHIHRVDMDSLEDLGKWAGLDLSAHDVTYTKGINPLKEAVANRDEEAIEKAIKNTGGWKRFKRDAKIYAPFYEQLGYDIWWKNG